MRSSFRYAASQRVALRADATYYYERQRWPLGGGFNGFNDNQGVSGWAEATLAATGGVWRARVYTEHFEYKYRSAQGDLPIANTGPPPQTEDLLRGAGRAEPPGRAQLARLRRAGELPLRGRAGPPADGDRRRMNRWKCYAQDALRLGHVLLNGGARYTWNSQWDGNLSPTVGRGVGAGEPAAHQGLGVARLPRTELQGAGLDLRQRRGGLHDRSAIPTSCPRPPGRSTRR